MFVDNWLIGTERVSLGRSRYCISVACYSGLMKLQRVVVLYELCSSDCGHLFVARWAVEDASIFSVADGKKLAETPVRVPTAFEAARLRKVDKVHCGPGFLVYYRTHMSQSELRGMSSIQTLHLDGRWPNQVAS